MYSIKLKFSAQLLRYATESSNVSSHEGFVDYHPMPFPVGLSNNTSWIVIKGFRRYNCFNSSLDKLVSQIPRGSQSLQYYN